MLIAVVLIVFVLQRVLWFISIVWRPALIIWVRSNGLGRVRVVPAVVMAPPRIVRHLWVPFVQRILDIKLDIDLLWGISICLCVRIRRSASV